LGHLNAAALAVHAVLSIYLQFRQLALFVHNVLVDLSRAESFFGGAVLLKGMERCVFHARLNPQVGRLVVVVVGT